MGTITGTEIINRCAIQLLDTANVRWTRPELLGWICDAQRQIIQKKPDANAVTSVMRLAPGTRQSVPAGGWMLLNIYRNFQDAAGTLPGRALRVASRQLLDAQNPWWHQATAVTQPANYIFDAKEPDAFYVYPPADGNGYVEINYAAVPVDLPAEASPIDILDIYMTTIMDYVLYRANSKDAEYAPGMQLAQAYYAAFADALSGQEKIEQGNSPNQSIPPKNQPVPGATS